MSGLKTKTIRKVLRAKVDSWIRSVEDDELKKKIKQDVIVTGGSIASMFLGEDVKDFDVYFKTKETAQAVAVYYSKIFCDEINEKDRKAYQKTNPNSIRPVQCDLSFRVEIEEVRNLKGELEERVRIKSYGRNGAFMRADNPGYGAVDGDEVDPDMANDIVTNALAEPADEGNPDKKTEKKYHPIYISENAITLSSKVQIVTRFFGDANQIHKNYDFEHCKNVYDRAADELITNTKALECLLSKTLLYTGSLYPLCSMFRMKKFLERGWKISAGEMLKIGRQIGMIDFNDINQLREQLVGVDALYFSTLLALIREESEKGVSIDDTKIVELIDKVFNN